MPEELSQKERMISIKISLIVAAIFVSTLWLAYFLFFKKTVGIEIFEILLLIWPIFIIFGCFELVFERERRFFILIKIFLLVLSVFCLFYLKYSRNPLAEEIGGIIILAWIIDFIREIFILVRKFFKGESVVSSGEEKWPSGVIPKRHYLGSKNLGFKGFIWAALIFLGVVIIIYLFAYLTR